MLFLTSLLALLLLSSMSPSHLPVPLNVRGEHQVVLERPATQPPPTLPVPNGTLSFWLRNPNVLPEPTHGSEGALTPDADICIIGSGITGVSAAYHLAKSFSGDELRSEPVKAVVLEAREFCSGATGRNGGHLTAHAYRGFKWLHSLYGKDEAIRGLAIERYTAGQIFRILKEHDKVEHVDFVPGGRVILLFTAQEHDEARADYEAAKEAGIDLSDVEWLSVEDAQARFGASYPAVIIPGNNLWPLKLVSVLYNLAANATDNFSLTLHTRTPVTSISPSSSSSRRWTLATPRGEVSCSYVLHATNAYTAHLLPWMHGPNGIVPTRGQVLAVRAATPDALGRAGFIGNDGFEYWFPRPRPDLPLRGGGDEREEQGQLVILGGGREATRDRGYEFYQVDDSVVNPEVGAVLRRFLPAVFPGKFEETGKVEMEWTGVMGYTRSHEPFVGPVLNPNEPGSHAKYAGQYISAGYTGHGMPRAFACAEAVAGMIKANMAGEKWTPPEWFPVHYLTTQEILS